MSITIFLLALGLTARVTRFVTDDIAGGPIRALVIRLFGEGSKAHVWVTCPWCAGLWFAAAAVLTGWFYGDTDAWQLIALIASVSWLYAILATWLDGSKLVYTEDEA